MKNEEVKRMLPYNLQFFAEKSDGKNEPKNDDNQNDDSHNDAKTSTKAGVVHYTPIEMPKISIAEMLCDWASFTNSTPRIWFKKCMQYYAQIMHPTTFKLVDRVTKTIWGE